MLGSNLNWLHLIDVGKYFSLCLQEVRRRGLKVVVAGIPKTIDNDIPVPLLTCQQLNCCLHRTPHTSNLFTFSTLFIAWQVIDRSFGFDTAVEEAQRAINAAHVEAESSENCIGLVKLMGRYSGKLLFLIEDIFSSTCVHAFSCIEVSSYLMENI